MKFDINYYELLEVRETASSEVISMAYKALARKYHPDLYKGDNNFATEMMKKINEAYDVLSNPEKRKQYDDYLSYLKNFTNTNKKEQNENYYYEKKESQYSHENNRRNQESTNKDNSTTSEESNKQKKNKGWRLFYVAFTLIIIAFYFYPNLFNYIGKNNSENFNGNYSLELQYTKGLEKFYAKKYEEASAIFEDLNNYKNSKELVLKCKYNIANIYYYEKNYEKALYLFEELGEFSNSAQKADYCRNNIYNEINAVESTAKNEITEYKDNLNYSNSQTSNIINYEITDSVDNKHPSISEIENHSENNNIKENENKEVSLNDATIEAEVRIKLGKPLGSLTISDLLMITDINVYTNTKPKVYLNDLVYMENLKTFVGARCSISDLNPLKELKNLTYIDIGNNPITDLNPLSNLTKLQVLHINSDGPSDYTDISFLKSLSNLVELHLNVTWVNDLSPILSLTNLKTLKIDYSTKYKTIDVNMFMELPNLMQLVINGKEVQIIKDLPPNDSTNSQNLKEPSNIDESKLIKEFGGIWLQKVYLNDGTEYISVFTINIKERSLTWVVDHYFEEYDFHEHQEYSYPIKIVSQKKLEFFQAGSSTATDSLELNSDGTLTRTFYENNDKKILTRE